MANNNVDIPLAPMVGSEQWYREIHDRNRVMMPKKRADPTWATTNNDLWWNDLYMRREEDLVRIDGLMGPPTLKNLQGHQRARVSPTPCPNER
jgi:hypothetical protein